MGQALRLASNFVVMNDKFQADTVEVTPDLYQRLDEDYKDFAGQREMLGATQGIARVFATLFKLSGNKDCEKARKAYDYFRQAVQLQRGGEARRLLVREGMALKKRIDEACREAAEDEAE